VIAVEYIQGADLPDFAVEWADRDGAPILFGSIAHTFELKIGRRGNPATLTKSTGITGADTSPNVTVAWSTSGELNTLAVGTYDADLIATRTSDGKQRKLRFRLVVLPAVT
jgi:hypothetical protein